MSKLIVNITNEAMVVIVRNSDQDFKQTGRLSENGSWDIDIDKDLLEQITERMYDGETLSDVIVRVDALTHVLPH